MATKTSDFTLNRLNSMIEDLEDARSAYDAEEEMAASASIIFSFLGVIGGPAGVCFTAGVLTAGLAIYYDEIENAITTTISVIEEYKDIMQSDPNYDKVRLKVTYATKKIDGTNYIYPTDFEFVAIHSINPPGWQY